MDHKIKRWLFQARETNVVDMEKSHCYSDLGVKLRQLF